MNATAKERPHPITPREYLSDIYLAILTQFKEDMNSLNLKGTTNTHANLQIPYIWPRHQGI